MKTLALDTSHRFLTIALIENDRLVAGLQQPSLKTQSETIMVQIERLFEEAGWKPTELNALVLTDGPGSYTGLRISMTVAKVLGLIQGIKLYTLSSLQLLAGTQEDAYAVMDARAKRVYLGHYRNGLAVSEESAITIEEALTLIPNEAIVVGDATLVHHPEHPSDCLKSFIDLKAQWKPVDNVHTLVPRYLKDTDHYGL